MCIEKRKKKSHSHYIRRYLDTFTSHSEFGFVCGKTEFHVTHLTHPQTNHTKSRFKDRFFCERKLLFLLILSVFRWTITTDTQKQETTSVLSLGLGHLFKSHERSRRFRNWQHPSVGDSVCRLSSCWKNRFLLFFFSHLNHHFSSQRQLFLFESYFCIVIDYH